MITLNGPRSPGLLPCHSFVTARQRGPGKGFKDFGSSWIDGPARLAAPACGAALCVQGAPATAVPPPSARGLRGVSHEASWLFVRNFAQDSPRPNHMRKGIAGVPGTAAGQCIPCYTRRFWTASGLRALAEPPARLGAGVRHSKCPFQAKNLHELVRGRVPFCFWSKRGTLTRLFKFA